MRATLRSVSSGSQQTARPYVCTFSILARPDHGCFGWHLQGIHSEQSVEASSYVLPICAVDCFEPGSIDCDHDCSLLHTEADGAAISRKGVDAGKAQKQATDTYVVASELESQAVPHFTESEPESITDQVQTQASHALSWVKAVATRSPVPTPPRKNEVHLWVETVSYGLSKAANAVAEHAISVQHAFASDPTPLLNALTNAASPGVTPSNLQVYQSTVVPASQPIIVFRHSGLVVSRCNSKGVLSIHDHVLPRAAWSCSRWQLCPT